MSRLKHLIHEIHRRSVWQVIGIYLLGGWVALQVVETLVDSLGLPDWFPAFAVMLLIVGFPIVVATAFVQEGVGTREETPAGGPAPDSPTGDRAETPPSRGGASAAPGVSAETSRLARTNLAAGTGSLDRPSTRPPKIQRLLTWRNAIGGGVLAFALWGVIAAAWMGMSAWVERGQTENGLAVDPGLSAPVDRLKAVAVLPFENLSTDEENAFFADGIHEDVLTQLSKIQDLTVISRTSVMLYRDEPKPLAEISRELGVGAIVEGSVRRSGDDVRITAQLIDAATDRHLWADNYDRALTAANVFAIQSDIARRIADALAATLSPAEESRITRQPTENLEAYEATLRGREAYRFYTDGGNDEAIRLFSLAIEQDPEYAEPWAGLADAYAQRALRYGYGLQWADSAEAAARRAIELDPELASAYKAAALPLAAKGDYVGMSEYNLRAVELDPNYSDPLMNLGVAYWTLGRLDEALEYVERSFRLQPNVAFARSNRAYTYAVLGDFATAGELIADALAINPEDLDARGYLVVHALFEGNVTEAVRVAEEVLAMSEQPRVLMAAAEAFLFAGDDQRVTQLADRSLRLAPDQGPLWNRHIRTVGGFAHRRLGDMATARRMLEADLARAMALWERAPGVGLTAWHIATNHAALGNHEEALEWMDQHRDAALGYTFYLAHDPIWDDLRDDPRFQEILSDMLAKVERMRENVERAEGIP